METTDLFNQESYLPRQILVEMVFLKPVKNAIRDATITTNFLIIAEQLAKSLTVEMVLSIVMKSVMEMQLVILLPVTSSETHT